MSPYVAYLLGLFTILIILIPFYVMSMRFKGVSNVYKDVLCNQAI